jgi:nucleoside phosphorylase
MINNNPNRNCSIELVKQVLNNDFILIITANSIEFKSLENILKPLNGLDYIVECDIDSHHLYFGILGVAPVGIVKLKDQGSIKKLASHGVLHDIYSRIIYNGVFAVGNCFAINDDLDIGNVIASSQLIPYDISEIKDGKRSSAEPVDSIKFKSLLELCKTDDVFKELDFDIVLGQVLSSETLVNCKKHKSEIKECYTEALAGEMEGTGVATFCSKKKIPWGIVKAISDKGDGKKHETEDKKPECAANAAITMSLILSKKRYLDNYFNINPEHDYSHKII